MTTTPARKLREAAAQYLRKADELREKADINRDDAMVMEAAADAYDALVIAYLEMADDLEPEVENHG